MLANLRFKIVSASLIVGRKLTVFTLYLWAISKYKPPGAYYCSEGRFNGGVFRYEFGGIYLEGLIHGGVYFRNFTVKETLLIRDLQPSLNENVSREKLYLF